ncbi:MAG: carbohydrate ABC transporter permease [Anaerolineales bacterium]
MNIKRIATVTFQYLTLLAGVIIAVLPILVVFIGSLKTHKEFYSSSPLSLPANWLNFQNYYVAFTKGKMLDGLWNTIIILVISVGGSILFGTMAAYVVNRIAFRGRGLVTALFLVAALLPGIINNITTFPIVVSLGLYNSIWSMIILSVGTDILAIYIFLQYLDSSIPRELDESATIDGASHFTIYTKIIMPLLKPAIATVIIIKGVAVYNDFYTPFLYMPSSKLGVISTSLFRFKGPYSAQWEVICAGIILAIIPTLVVFLLLQKYIYNGLVQGAIK